MTRVLKEIAFEDEVGRFRLMKTAEFEIDWKWCGKLYWCVSFTEFCFSTLGGRNIPLLFSLGIWPALIGKKDSFIISTQNIEEQI